MSEADPSELNEAVDRQVDCDMLVVGSGAGALTAAAVAAHRGLNVLLVEKAAVFGGTSALSGGIIWMPCNPLMDTEAYGDSADRAMTYLRAVIGDLLRSEVVQAYLHHGPEMMSFLEANTEVHFQPTAYPDYQEHLDGGMRQGRSVIVEPYDGRALQEWWPRLRQPFREWCVLGSVMVNPADLPAFLNATRSPRALLKVSGLGLRYACDLLRYGRGARLYMGNALIARLLRSAVDAGVRLWSDTPALKLMKKGDRATGAIVMRQGKAVFIGARRGVVLASGGFPHDRRRVSELVRFPGAHQTVCVDTDTGDGINLATAIGGVLGDGNFQNVVGTQVTMMRDAAGETIRIPAIRRDRVKPGFILVDQRGERFANEALPYNELCHIMLESAERVPSILICDHVRLRRYGVGLVRPGPWFVRPLGAFIRSGHLVKAASIAALADRLGISSERLNATVARMNEFALAGEDRQFGKGGNFYDRWQGDPDNRPNPSLGPIETPPFYAVRVWPGNIGTACGLAIDERARVLNHEGRAIEGLYACGTDANSIFSGHYPGGGSTLGPAMTFGYIAAMEASQGQNA